MIFYISLHLTFDRRPRRARASGRKFAMVSRWDPRGPNIKEGLKQLESMHYENPENLQVFPRGSIILAFRRGRNLGEIIAPTKPLRERPERVEGGSFACDSRRCPLHRSGALQLVNFVFFPKCIYVFPTFPVFIGTLPA